jgi:hypothetical protein
MIATDAPNAVPEVEEEEVVEEEEEKTEKSND